MKKPQQNATLSLFDAAKSVEHSTPLVATTVAAALPEPLLLPLAHPYARYGLGVALIEGRIEVDEISEATLRPALIGAIEAGMERFRMRTPDDPALTRELTFRTIAAMELERDVTLVQSAGLAARGIYLFPSIVTSDGNAKDTYGNALAVLQKLRDGEKLDSIYTLSRSFAPTTAKINNGTASQSPPKGTLLEAACALVTTLTPIKPSAWPGRNTVIIPDLPLPQLRQFIRLFDVMSQSGARSDLMSWQLPEAAAPKPNAKTSARKVSKKDTAPKSDYHRPRLHGGNYPFAPRDAGVFGAVGLLGAIGRWAGENNRVADAKAVLESLANAPLYIISYDKISVVRFGHHIVNLSLEGRLSELVDALWLRTRAFSDMESPRINRQLPVYQLFYLATSRFLQQFSAPSFADFLATRAEYPHLIQSLFEEYFMAKQQISKDIVTSARLLGQHLNRSAYFVANDDYEPGISGRDDKVRKTKAKILVELESAIMSADSAPDMLRRVSERFGRLTLRDLPASSTAFYDAAASGEELSFENARHLLIAYLRMQSPYEAKVKAPEGELDMPPLETVPPSETALEDSSLPMQDN